MDEKMSGRLRHTHAKRANPTIWTSALLKAVRGPKSILDGQPSKGLYLGWAKIFQDDEQMGEDVAPKNWAL
jgi:hypothetical protein